MLLDRGLLERQRGRVPRRRDARRARRPRDPARPDRSPARRPRPRGAPTARRRLRARQDVLRSRPRRALRRTDEEDVDALLASLVRKEVLALDADPRSPERGQYGFLQALVQRVAYETLSRHDRKAKHLARRRATSPSEAGIDPDEIAEVIAAHYLDAFRAEPRARATPTRSRPAPSSGSAGPASARPRSPRRRTRSARSTAAAALARRARSSGPALLERAGELAPAPTSADALERAARGRGPLRARNQAHPRCARASRPAQPAPSGSSAASRRRSRLLEHAFAVLSADEPDATFATLAAESARVHHFAGNPEQAAARIEAALDAAEELALSEVCPSALNTKA